MGLPPHARDWLRQWESAGPALEEVRRRELRELSAQKALEATEALLALAPLCPPASGRWLYSGLVEQQALLNPRRP